MLRRKPSGGGVGILHSNLHRNYRRTICGVLPDLNMLRGNDYSRAD